MNNCICSSQMYLGYLVRDLKLGLQASPFQTVKLLALGSSSELLHYRTITQAAHPSALLLLFELNTAYCVLGFFGLFATIVLMMIYTYYFCALLT